MEDDTIPGRSGVEATVESKWTKLKLSLATEKILE